MVLDETYPARQDFVLLKNGVNALIIKWLATCLSKSMVYRELREGILKEKYSGKVLMAAADVDDDDLIDETIMYIPEKRYPNECSDSRKRQIRKKSEKFVLKNYTMGSNLVFAWSTRGVATAP